MNWEIFIASFTGSLIELVEILGVVIVVGRVAGWRNALIGASGGIGLTLIVSLLLGKSLMLIPINYLQLIAGAFLLAFGQAWTRSVVKYYGGIPKPGKDEELVWGLLMASAAMLLRWRLRTPTEESIG